MPRVLIVEDDADSRGPLRGILESEGFAVIEAANGKEALDLLRLPTSKEPDLIITDLEMPVMSGWELLAVIKRDQCLARIPVLIVSGRQPSRQAENYDAIAGYVLKPFDFEQFLVKVRACLGNPKK